MRIALALLLLALWPRIGSAAGLSIEDAQDLQTIERSGFSFGETVVGPTARGADNAELYRHEPYRTIIDSIGEDLNRLRSADWQLGTAISARAFST